MLAVCWGRSMCPESLMGTGVAGKFRAPRVLQLRRCRLAGERRAPAPGPLSPEQDSAGLVGCLSSSVLGGGRPGAL